MGLTSWVLFLGAAAASLALVVYLYRRWEPPGRGRVLLAALRWGALVLLILLLFNPEVPLPGAPGSGARDRVLLDASLSMLLPAEPGGTVSRWDRAREQARELAGSREILIFGDAPRLIRADSLAGVTPGSAESRLLPALQAASEAGARQVIVITDGDIEDAAEISRVLPELDLSIRVRTVGSGQVANRALVELETPVWAASGEPVEVQVGVTALGGSEDSVTVVAHHEGRRVAEARLQVPEPGRVARGTLRFDPASPEGGGLVRYDFSLEPADAVPADDLRSAYIYVSADPPGVAVVSFQPDWEPRFLFPVLEQSLGLPIRAYMRTDPTRFARIGTGADGGRPHTEAEVRRAVESAELLILHGFDQNAPVWARQAAQRARRVLVFPRGELPEGTLPLSLPPTVPGEWYAAAEVPASPVAPLLTSMRVEQLPPLTGLRLTQPTGGAWSPLAVSRDRRGDPAPALLAGETAGRRWAVALGEGYWQWAFRGGEARQAYRSLWGSIAGWLVQNERAIAVAPVRPASPAVERGRAVQWVAPGLAADSIAVHIAAEDGTTVLDSVVAVLRGDTASTRALPPGHYRYSLRAFARGDEVAHSQGPVTVESYSPEFARMTGALPDWSAAASGLEVRAARMVVPLYTTPWPYLLLVLLLSIEWVLRRRWGLR